MSSRPKVRLIQPLGPRVLVRLEEEADRTESGLFLPQGVKERHEFAHYARVIEVARDTLATEEVGENVSGVPLGVHVLFPKHAGIPVPWDESLRLVKTSEIVAIVEEVEEVDDQEVDVIEDEPLVASQRDAAPDPSGEDEAH